MGWRMARRQARSGAERDGRDLNNGRIAVIRNIVRTALLSTALMTVAVGGALAKDTIVWWDFLGGGDGVRMKALIDSEGVTPARRDRLAGAYNRGYRGYALTYRVCTPAAHEAAARYVAEGDRLSHALAGRFGG